MRLSSAAVLLLVVAVAAVVGGALAGGRVEHRAATAQAPAAKQRARVENGLRRFSDPRFAITFDYPLGLRRVAVKTHGTELGHRAVAAIALYDATLGYIEVIRADDQLDKPVLDSGASRLTRQVARLVRGADPAVRFKAIPHRIGGLPVAELRGLGRPQEVALNVFTWVGRDGYRLACHVPADATLRRQMIGICRAAMRSLRPRAAAATATRPRARGHA